MTGIRIQQDTIILEPPQRLAMIELVREGDGDRLQVLHQVGYLTGYDFEIVWKSPPLEAPPTEKEGDILMPGIPAAIIAAFPSPAEIDVSHAPSEFRTISRHDPALFLKPGGR